MIQLEQVATEGAPQVGITITDTTPDTIVSVEMTWGDGRWRGVLGAAHREASGGAYFIDYYPPLNVNVQYRVVIHEGEMDGADTASIIVPSTDAYLHDPRDPRSYAPVAYRRFGDTYLLSGSLIQAAYDQQVELVPVEASDTPVAAVGTRQVASQVPLRLEHRVAAQQGRLRNLLMSAGTLVATGFPSTILPPVAPIVVGAVTERRDDDRIQYSTWDLTATVVRPPSLRIVVPWWTYEQVKAMWAGATYADVALARPGDTYLDWKRDPEPP